MAVTEITEVSGVISVDANAINDLTYYFTSDETEVDSGTVQISAKNGGIVSILITIGDDDAHTVQVKTADDKWWTLSQAFNTAVLRDTEVEDAISTALVAAIPNQA